jgi:hypothetical protein
LYESASDNEMFGVMSVEGLVAVLVLNDEEVAVTLLWTAEDDFASGHSAHHSSGRGRDINAIMPFFLAVKWIAPPAKRRGKRSGHREDELVES